MFDVCRLIRISDCVTSVAGLCDYDLALGERAVVLVLSASIVQMMRGRGPRTASPTRPLLRTTVLRQHSAVAFFPYRLNLGDHKARHGGSSFDGGGRVILDENGYV